MQPTKSLQVVGNIVTATSMQLISSSDRLVVAQLTYVHETCKIINKITTADSTSIMRMKQPWNIRHAIVLSRFPEGLRVALM